MHLYWIFFTGQPKVRLSARPRPEVIEAEEVSDEVVLTWAPCSKHDKSYEVEMWDLGKSHIFLIDFTSRKWEYLFSCS